ncbi:porin [Telluria beijingensis]|uniref:porin n=1 Tax=Telluria beijingensis TaxID=3068633 RepID=UPI0027953309|nr:porin [Massilia sp. REN29]
MRCRHAVLLGCAVGFGAMGTAAAQSSLSVGGLLDLGVFRGFDGVNQVGTVQRSNIAISGQEDLGGGNKLIFRLSTRMELDTGESEGAGYKPFWHDESTVGLAGAWGTLRVGRAMTAMWANDWKFDPWANFNRIASPAWYLWHPLTPSDPFANRGTAEYGRVENGIFYDSPALAGFTLRLSGSPERRREAGASGRPYSAVLEYGQGPLAAMAAFERNSLGERDTFVAGKVSVGAVALMAAWDDSCGIEQGARSRAVTLGASWKMGVNVLKAGWGRQRLDATANHFASLGLDHVLSRRTTLYASLGRQRQARSRTAFGMGLAHAF